MNYRGNKYKLCFVILLSFLVLISLSWIFFFRKHESMQYQYVLLKYNPDNQKEQLVIYNIVRERRFFRTEYKFNTSIKTSIDNIRFFDRTFRLLDSEGFFYYINRNNIYRTLMKKENGTAVKKRAYFSPFINVVRLNLANNEKTNIATIFGTGETHIPQDLKPLFSSNYDQYFKSKYSKEILSLPKHGKYYKLIDLAILNDNFNKTINIPDPIDYRLGLVDSIIKSSKYMDKWNESYQDFNPLVDLEDIAISSLAKYRLYINYNYYNYLNYKLYKKSAIYAYKKLLLDDKTNQNLEQCKKLGWHILVSKRDFFRTYGEKTKGKARLLVSNYPLYKISKEENIFPIPHKCWSPDGKYILFVGCLEKPGVGNIYSVEIQSGKTNKVLDANDKSGKYNPDLEWSQHGILITCRDGIYYKKNGSLIKKIKIPDDIHNLRNGKISPSGEEIIFFGKESNKVYLYCLNLNDNTINSLEIGEGEMEIFQGAWIRKYKITIINNQADYYLIPDNLGNDERFKFHFNSIKPKRP